MNRCGAFIKALSQKGETAALIHRPENIRYLTGYTGEGCLLVAKDAASIVTDSRYYEMAERQAPECECAHTGDGVNEASAVKALCARMGVTRLLVETDFLTYDDYKALENALDGIALAPLNQLVQDLRMVKDQSEIECLCKAAEISSQAFINILDKIHVGMTEKQVQIMLEFEMLNLGSEHTAFETISAAGVNGSLPHAVPSDHVIAEGELLTLDFGATYGGYCADITRTVGFGKVSPELRAIYDTVLEAHLMGLDAVRPGAVCADIDDLVRGFVRERYPVGVFGHGLGHGVGLYIHEMPRLSRGVPTVLKPGYTVTVEPGVYIPGLGGCRIEDTTILTEDGHLDPYFAPKQFIEL